MKKTTKRTDMEKWHKKHAGKTQAQRQQAFDLSFYNDEGVYDWARSISPRKSDAYEVGKAAVMAFHKDSFRND